MSSPGQPAGVDYTPDYHRRGPAISDTSSVQSIPPRHPPIAYFGQPAHSDSNQQWQTYDYLKREHGSLSGTPTNPSRQNTPHPRAGLINIHPPNLSVTFGAEEGSLENPRPARAYPNQYTRSSRNQMAEINAAYHKSYEDDDSSVASEDHAIWILVCFLTRLSHLIALNCR